MSSKLIKLVLKKDSNKKFISSLIVLKFKNIKKFKLDIPEFALQGSIVDKLNLRCHNLPEGN